MNNDLIQKQHNESPVKLSEEWFDQNKAALEEYNCWVEKCGVFSDGLRNF